MSIEFKWARLTPMDMSKYLGYAARGVRRRKLFHLRLLSNQIWFYSFFLIRKFIKISLLYFFYTFYIFRRHCQY